MKRTLMVLGSDRLLIALTELIEASAWFEVTPLPDDYWDVTVKDEHLPVEILVRQNAGAGMKSCDDRE